jgi:hypothetical protein
MNPIMNRTNFLTVIEYQAALDQIIVAAQYSIRIHDRDLEASGFNSAVSYEKLHHFCLAGGQRQIEILLDDTAYVQNRCPRLMTLLRDFSHVIEIRRTAADGTQPDYGFALGDRNMVLKRVDKSALLGQFDPDDAASAAVLHQQFDYLWQRAAGSVSATTLGLG